MREVAARLEVPGPAFEVEALWYDPVRWPAWVDGFGHLVELGEAWPHAGARVTWDSRPGGRGRVIERVLHHEARTGQELEVEDSRLRGVQRVAFTPHANGVEVALTLGYELKERHALTWAVDLLFVRRALADSLRRTLAGFARERAGDLDWAAQESR